MKKIIGIIGCGNMGSAIIKAVIGLLPARHLGTQEAGGGYWVIGYDKDCKKNKYIATKFKIKIARNSKDLVNKSDVVILAVKPQNMSEVLNEIKHGLDSSKILISVAAGISTTFIEHKVGKKIAVIRVMPNMPALVGAGISAVYKGRFAAASDLKIAKELFRNIGEVVEVKEKLMDAVTAISGSGPAYFFYLVEILIKAAVEMGVKKEIAVKLAVETALGSAKALKETKLSAEELRAKVTSKGGTTEAAFKEFFKHNLGGILTKGIKQAFERAKCL